MLRKRYGEDIAIERKLLTENISNSVNGFEGELDDLNFIEYLQNEAIYDRESRTYVYIDNSNGKIVAFASLSCSTLILGDEDVQSYAPAILLDKFVVDSNYRHLAYSALTGAMTLSDVILMDIIDYSESIAESVIGAKYIVLYSTPEAFHFYQKHVELRRFDSDMIPSCDPRIADCIPMYMLI